ncbi:hypothetical protein [Rhodococcus sp. NCIMB 12038]|uniref:hypothetical protein n=1 Tax=Rhodococcus sp. NCIMB 12038 TaxID=933800 RepID=UPI00117A60C0|nr:hypothetical protein [Rhodococcus sp. NCIMB 12038]
MHDELDVCRIGVPGDVHWRSISKDSILTPYGYDPDSRVADPLGLASDSRRTAQREGIAGVDL